MVNYIFAASHAIDQAGNMNEDDQTREMNDEDQATDMLDDDQTRGMEETEMDISENEIEEQNESGDVKLQLDSAFLKLKRIFLDRIEHDQKGFKKALTTFDKHLDRMPKSNDAVLQKALCTFGQDSIAPLKLSKCKNSRLIPLQVKRGLSIHCTMCRLRSKMTLYQIQSHNLECKIRFFG